jgi:hypothetical protein
LIQHRAARRVIACTTTLRLLRHPDHAAVAAGRLPPVGRNARTLQPGAAIDEKPSCT